MLMILSSCLSITDPSPAVCKWAEQNLVLDNPEYVRSVKVNIGRHTAGGLNIWSKKSKTYRFVPRYVCLYAKDGNTMYVPAGCISGLMAALEGACPYVDVSRPVHARKTYASVPLYAYQERAVTQCLQHIRSPLMPSGGVLVGPCGCGKTRMGLAAIGRTGVKTLWLTHTHVLLMQSYKAAAALFGEDGLSVTTDGKLDIGDRITFATVQTLDRMDLAELYDDWGLVVVDECHHCVGDATQVRMFAHVVGSLNCPKLGLTATPDRADGLIPAMYALLGPQLAAVTAEDVRERVVPIDYRAVNAYPDLDLSACLTSQGTISSVKLVSQLCSDENRNVLIADIVYDAPKPCLVLSSRLAHLDALNALIPGSVLLKKDRESRADVTLATYQLVGEGYDRPELRTVVLATPEGDPTRIRQAVGRVMRTAPGKMAGVVYDVVDRCDYRRWLKLARQRAGIIAEL